ncbi:hypothetical protein D770_04325 [Flammeovirgaceae bacterium 311]|nr:hypothetical protein D770_04325 [Flammeovirgaceae bacterium 311]
MDVGSNSKMAISINNQSSKIESVLREDIKWGQIIYYFMLHGIFILYTAKRDNILQLNAEHLFSLIVTVVIVGLFIGVISNLIVGLLVALIGKAFKANNSIKNIYKALAYAYRPFILTALLILTHITIAFYFESSFIQDVPALIVIVMVIIRLAIGLLALWSLVLLIKGLMAAQGLSIGQTIINYLIAAVGYTPLYYLLMMKI